MIRSDVDVWLITWLVVSGNFSSISAICSADVWQNSWCFRLLLEHYVCL